MIILNNKEFSELNSSNNLYDSINLNNNQSFDSPLHILENKDI